MGCFDDHLNSMAAEAGSKRADQELSWDNRPVAKWGLRIVNGLGAILGVVVLALCGMMISEENATAASLNPLIVVGAGSLGIGLVGILATYKRKIMALYWLGLFFGTVLAVWMLAYATLNFARIEEKVMIHFEENWGELVVALPEEVLDKVPRSCGGNKVNQCDFSVDGTEPGFADPSSPTNEEITACTMGYSGMVPEEGEDQVICVYEAPCGLPSMCVGRYGPDNDGDGEGDLDCEADTSHAPATCLDPSTGEACEDAYSFWCDMVSENCPAGCTFTPANDGAASCPDGCIYLSAEAGEALCVEETVESTTEGGRRLQDAASEPEPFTLGSSKDFEAQCWNTIKETMMSNMRSVGIFLVFVVLLEGLCMYWCISVLTVGTAIGAVRKAIDIGMTFTGGLLFITGLIMASELSSDTLYLTVPCILIGGLMLVLGVFFGCCSKDNPTCAKWAVCIYVFLFIVMVVMAFATIAYEDTVRDMVAEKGGQWLEKFCDTSCHAEIQAKMAGSRDADSVCDDPPVGEGECELSYAWLAERHLDPACNSTLPHTISQLCKCPCQVAENAAQVKGATEEYIIKKFIGSVNTLGWVCILISMYLLIEVLCHLYNNYQAKDIEAEAEKIANEPRGI